MPMQPYGQLGSPKRGKGMLIAVILLSLLLLSTLVFALWAYSNMSNYKNNSDAITAAAVQKATQETQTSKDNEYLEKMKSPYRTYKGSETYGSVEVTYPNTWSAYVDEKGSNGSAVIDGYFNPGFVPGTGTESPFALRMQVSTQKYEDYVKQMESRIKQGTVSASAYRAPKVPSALGTRFEGEINPGKKVSLVALPLRDKTLLIWTESNTILSDFNNIVLAQLTFIP